MVFCDGAMKMKLSTSWNVVGNGPAAEYSRIIPMPSPVYVMLLIVSMAVTPRGLASIVKWKPPLASLPTRSTKWTMPFAVRTSGGGQALTTGWLSNGRYVDVALWLEPAVTGTIRLRLRSRLSGRANRLLAFIKTSSSRRPASAIDSPNLRLNRRRGGVILETALRPQNARDRSSCQGRVASQRDSDARRTEEAAFVVAAFPGRRLRHYKNKVPLKSSSRRKSSPKRIEVEAPPPSSQPFRESAREMP